MLILFYSKLQRTYRFYEKDSTGMEKMGNLQVHVSAGTVLFVSAVCTLTSTVGVTLL